MPTFRALVQVMPLLWRLPCQHRSLVTKITGIIILGWDLLHFTLTHGPKAQWMLYVNSSLFDSGGISITSTFINDFHNIHIYMIHMLWMKKLQEKIYLSSRTLKIYLNLTEGIFWKLHILIIWQREKSFPINELLPIFGHNISPHYPQKISNRSW